MFPVRDLHREKQENIDLFRPTLRPEDVVSDGVVQPYDDSPLDDKPVEPAFITI